MIEEVRAVQQLIVAADVPPEVGLAVADEEDARLLGREGVEERHLQERVVDVAVLEGSGGPVQAVEQLLARARRAPIGRIPTRLHRKVAPTHVEDVLERPPGGIYRDVPVKLRQAVQPLEYGEVGIRAEFVRVDARVRVPGEHLVVARIGEGQAVGDAGNAALGLVAENLAAHGDRAPEEREQGLAPLGRVGAPELAPQLPLRLPDAAVLVVQELGVRSGEDLLPAQPVAHDEHDGARLEHAGHLGREGRPGCDERQHEDAPKGSGDRRGQHLWLLFR